MMVSGERLYIHSEIYDIWVLENCKTLIFKTQTFLDVSVLKGPTAVREVYGCSSTRKVGFNHLQQVPSKEKR